MLSTTLTVTTDLVVRQLNGWDHGLGHGHGNAATAVAVAASGCQPLQAQQDKRAWHRPGWTRRAVKALTDPVCTMGGVVRPLNGWDYSCSYGLAMQVVSADRWALSLAGQLRAQSQTQTKTWRLKLRSCCRQVNLMGRSTARSACAHCRLRGQKNPVSAAYLRHICAPGAGLTRLQ